MWISEYCANAGLFSANRTASFPVENLTLWAATDRHALLLATLCLPLHTSADATVDGGPHLPIPENLATKLAHFDIIWGHSQETLFTTGIPIVVTDTRLGALLLTHHCRVLARAYCAVIVEKRRSIVINITTKQAAPKRKVKYFPLTQAFRAALSWGCVTKVLGARENGADFSHALCPASNTGALDTFASFRMKFFSFLVLHTFEQTAWTGRTAGSRML